MVDFSLHVVKLAVNSKPINFLRPASVTLRIPHFNGDKLADILFGTANFSPVVISIDNVYRSMMPSVFNLERVPSDLPNM